MKGKKLGWILGALALAGAVAYFLIAPPAPETVPEEPSGKASAGAIRDAAPAAARPQSPAEEPAAAEPSADAEEAEQPLTPEEKAEREQEAKVEAFDELTDRWLEPTKGGVTMADVDRFVAAFAAVPKDRQDECIHRALNLIPDDNVMLLAGVLMDKSADRDIVETVFNDILNRDEDVKKPVLNMIFADKKHPCWADTAWILDVTGDLPGKK